LNHKTRLFLGFPRVSNRSFGELVDLPPDEWLFCGWNAELAPGIRTRRDRARMDTAGVAHADLPGCMSCDRSFSRLARHRHRTIGPSHGRGGWRTAERHLWKRRGADHRDRGDP